PLHPRFTTRRSSDPTADAPAQTSFIALDFIQVLQQHRITSFIALDFIQVLQVLLVSIWPLVSPLQHRVWNGLDTDEQVRGKKAQDRKSTRLNSSHVK